MIYIFGENDADNNRVGKGETFQEALVDWSSYVEEQARCSEFVRCRPLVVDGNSLAVSITPKTTYDVVIIRNDE